MGAGANRYKWVEHGVVPHGALLVEDGVRPNVEVDGQGGSVAKDGPRSDRGRSMSGYAWVSKGGRLNVGGGEAISDCSARCPVPNREGEVQTGLAS